MYACYCARYRDHTCYRGRHVLSDTTRVYDGLFSAAFVLPIRGRRCTRAVQKVTYILDGRQIERG